MTTNENHQSKQTPHHSKLTALIWSVANNLRGPYKPAQYRKVMLPLIVLARFDAILAKHAVQMKEIYDAEQLKEESKRKNEKVLGRYIASQIGMKREQPLYNISGLNLSKVIADSEHVLANLTNYILGFSPLVKDIFDKFEFESELVKLEQANILFKVVEDFMGKLKEASIDLSPSSISNLQMGYVFEDLVRRFNEQANEEAGDHFTPREVIKLMVNVIFHEDQQELSKSGVHRTLYDPTIGTGGMLSVAEMYLKGYNANINLGLFGQEYNPESYAICCSDLLIKDEPANNVIFGNTLGISNNKKNTTGFVPHDGHQNKQFHYMFANPPYGVSWKNEESYVKAEASEGDGGRFSAGLPRINDGSLLFLQHMISKMHDAPENGGDGSRIAVVFNGSPMFTGDAGSGESNIRRWIIENDWLEAVIALPDQMFYNTGIYTYIWIVSNKKSVERKGKVQLIDATSHYQKMSKSLGNKRNELSEQHIAELTQLYANLKDGDTSQLVTDKQGNAKVCSKIFNNQDFGYLKITVERPLRLNFAIIPERIAKLSEQTAFNNLAKSKKIKDKAQIAKEQKAGEANQQTILTLLNSLADDTNFNKLNKNRAEFKKLLEPKLKTVKLTKADGEALKLPAPVKKAIYEALSERDPTADICTDSKGNPEPDTQLRDTELVPLPQGISLPLPVHFDNQTGLDKLLELVTADCEQYMDDEVLPHVPDAWVDYSKTKVGYEIPLNRHFYVYEPPRDLADIKADITKLEQEILEMLGGLV